VVLIKLIVYINYYKFYYRAWGAKFVSKDLFSFKFKNQEETFSNSNEEFETFMNNHHTIIETRYRQDNQNNNNNNNNLNNINITKKTNKIDNDSTNIDTEISPTNYEEMYTQNCLDKYYIICLYKDCLYVNSFENGQTQINHGKIELLKNYFRNLPENQRNHRSIFNLMLYYAEYSRYEFVHISKIFRKLIVGNRQGDIQIYDLEFMVDKDNKCIINKEPLAIIECGDRICGFKIIEFEESIESAKLEIYLLTIKGEFICYKMIDYIN
jgi:hypothetical protein